MNIEINNFINACVAKGMAEQSGNSEADKLHFDTITSVYHFLKSNNKLNDLVELFEHENPYVRLWAAYYSLQTTPSKAESTLEKLSKEKGFMAGFSAQITLNEWRKGNLKF
ncbi:MAG: DUF2019 domain-containing protein [Oscillospiraceae bacterium]|nr:DUF2019 domain-containing protein [Oscillospiraceae bacterium]